MKYFTGEGFGRTFVLSLDQGDYLLESINNLIQKENIRNGIVATAMGTLDQCVLHMVMTTGYPAADHFEHWEKPLELASATGIIADGKAHIHAVVSDLEKAYAGHLEEGCRVLYLLEVTIIELVSPNLTRIMNDKNIWKLADK